MDTTTRRLPFALLLGLLIVATPPAARADDDDGEDDVVAFPLTAKALLWGCRTGCYAVSPKSGALLCLTGSEGLACADCQGAWVAPGTRRAEDIAWKRLQMCGQMSPWTDPKAVAALNAAGKGARPVDALVTLGTLTRADMPAHAVHGPLALEIDRRELRVLEGGQVVGAAPWDEGLEESAEVELALYALDGPAKGKKPGARSFLVALEAQVPGMVVSESRWFVFTAEAPPAAGKPLPPDDALAARCTATAECPEDYAKVAPYLAGVCAGDLSDAALDALDADARAGRVSTRALIAVFNVHGAMTGYAFKSERWLNAFFYGAGAWLPEGCRAKIKAYAKPGDVPAAVTRLRDRVLAIWRRVK
ncbi:MAG: hypothetical protein KC635_14650 [Myxococcales bacterium]|nr:hypothetical protein [Myxococcales bacterium]MCB9731717.1 hypothetical protein [Deltaproteobacteria bacterium]